jgi:hypothetical protein
MANLRTKFDMTNQPHKAKCHFMSLYVTLCHITRGLETGFPVLFECRDRPKSLRMTGERKGIIDLKSGYSGDWEGKGEWRGTESNRRRRDFQSLALPTELPRHFER